MVLQQPGSTEVEKVVSQCRGLGMRVRFVPHWYQLYVSDANIVEIDGVPLISLEERNIWPGALVSRESWILLARSVLLVLSLPLLLLAAALKIRSQESKRILQRNSLRPWRKSVPMYRLNINREDPTLVGFERFMAKFSLTELPQIWNVLAGHMSLVGPRPESPERVKHYSDWQRQRLALNPDLQDWRRCKACASPIPRKRKLASICNIFSTGPFFWTFL